jgi:hypothetical protein
MLMMFSVDNYSYFWNDKDTAAALHQVASLHFYWIEKFHHSPIPKACFTMVVVLQRSYFPVVLSPTEHLHTKEQV